MYRHELGEGLESPAQPSKIVCVGRNYAEHARELNNPVESSPLLFIKPATAAVAMAGDIAIPMRWGEVHHELEMAILIGQPLTRADVARVAEAVAGIGLAYDLTLRDVQNELKRKGHPWERAKGFDGACPLSPFVSAGDVDLQSLTLTLLRNGELQQQGNTAAMLFPVLPLISQISEIFTLLPGDVVLTGTPAGVGPLSPGDRLTASLGSLLTVESQIIGY